MTYPLTAILSDLHGNAPALDTALADAARRGVRRYVCLGDLIGYGADPRHTLARMMALCSGQSGEAGGPGLEPGVCLLGNHEHALLYGTVEDFNPRARAAIEWTRAELSRADGDDEKRRSYAFWDYLGALEPSARDAVAMFAHGSPRDPVREYMLPRDIGDPVKLRENFERLDARVCFVGHSHVPAIYREDARIFLPSESGDAYDLDTSPNDRAIVNVGSVGQPRDGDPRLSYVLFDGNTITFIRLEYDVDAAASAIRGVPALPDELADRLSEGR